MHFPPDIHTHNLLAAPGTALINLPHEALLHPETFQLQKGGVYSAGIHPWHLEQLHEQQEGLCHWLRSPQLIALGECGLDKCCDTDYALQQVVFSQQLTLAAERHLPVLIHCVRAWDDLLRLSRLLPAPEPRIIHGFRGKPQLAEQMLNAGFSLSFGAQYNEESFRLCPPERRFRETD